MKRSMAHIKTCVMWRDKSKQKGNFKGDPWRPCVIPLEKGNSSLWIRYRKKANEEGTCGKEKVGGYFPLESSGSIRWERREKGGKKKKEKKKKEEEKKSEKLHILSTIYGDRAIDFCRSKRQSSSTRRELHVGIRIKGFRQTPRGRSFSHTLVILGLRVI